VDVLRNTAEAHKGQLDIDILDAGRFDEASQSCAQSAPTAIAGTIPPDECLVIRAHSEAAGCLLILSVANDGTIQQLFPNAEGNDAEGRVTAGSTKILDDKYGFALQTSLDAGHAEEHNRIVALVTKTPDALRDFTNGDSRAMNVPPGNVKQLEETLDAQVQAAAVQDYVVAK